MTILFLTPRLALGASYVYDYLGDAFGPPVGIDIDISTGEVAIGDLDSDAKFCPQESGFFCFKSRFISFAVPARDLKENEQWDFNGLRFRLIGCDSKIEVLGVRLVVDVIISTDVHGVPQWRYLYKKSMGLIAMRRVGESGVIAVSKRGFGAIEGDYGRGDLALAAVEFPRLTKRQPE